MEISTIFFPLIAPFMALLVVIGLGSLTGVQFKELRNLLAAIVCFLIYFLLILVYGCGGMPSKKGNVELGKKTRAPSGYVDYKKEIK